jgi:hypothetical protein
MAAARYAVVASDGRLLCEVKCTPRHSVVVLARREDGKFGHPHATYHVDGTRHVRSMGGKLVEERGLPRLDQPMSGSVSVFALTITSEDAHLIRPSVRSSLSPFTEIIEIPDCLFERGQVRISVDIVGVGQPAPEQAFCEKALEKDLAGTTPPVRITVWKG